MANNNLANVEEVKNIIGSESFSRLIENMPGKLIRIPSTTEFYDKKKRDNLIREEFHNNKNVTRQELAVKYGLSLDRINKIVAFKPQKPVKTCHKKLYR
jgi:Mor family transcriptional regulator